MQNYPPGSTQPTPVVKPEQRQAPQYPPRAETYYLPQTPIPPVQPAPPHKRMNQGRFVLFIAAISLVLIVILGIIWQGITGTSSSQGFQDATATANAQVLSDNATASALETADAQSGSTSFQGNTPIAQSTTTSAFITFEDGTYQVGTDIKPGTYRTQTASQGCYYERLKGFSGTDSDILANNLTDYPAIVTILPSDKGFTSQNCGTWTSDLSQITQSKTTFSDGMFIVGTDITPGTYKTSGEQGCYYARLSGFDNTDSAIIANNLTDHNAIVTISASDKGFESHNCGTWVKI